MSRKASVVIERDDHGFYAWCPELKGYQSPGDTLDEALASIREAIEGYYARRGRAHMGGSRQLLGTGFSEGKDLAPRKCGFTNRSLEKCS